MITERSRAYGRIARTLRRSGAAGGAGEAAARLHEACATLVFAQACSPRERHAMTDAIIAVADLVARGGVSSELAAALVDDIGRCAPPGPAGRP
jgi:hypothetical protein